MVKNLIVGGGSFVPILKRSSVKLMIWCDIHQDQTSFGRSKLGQVPWTSISIIWHDTNPQESIFRSRFKLYVEEHHSWVFGPHMPSLSPGLSPNSISPAAKAWMAMLTGKPWPRCSSHLDLRLQLGEVPLDVLLQHNQALAVAKLVGGNVNSLSKVLTSPKTGKSFSLVQLFDQWEEGYQVRKHSSTYETRMLKLAEANKIKIHR